MSDPVLPRPAAAGGGTDAHDRALARLVAPPDWCNPVPAGRYHLVVLGGGPAGLVAAAGAAGLGARVALVERHRLGGDCLNNGCVPSKALLASAHAAARARRAGEFGIRVAGVAVDFPAVMARLRRIRAEIAPNDSAERFRGLGVDVFFGEAAFAGPDEVRVAGRALRFRRALIATGARAVLPPIPGLDGAGVLTHETLFQLTELPARLVVVGGGAAGCEMAQAFRRFGSEVLLLEAGPRLLPREDPDASAVLRARLEEEGVGVRTGVEIRSVERVGEVRRVRCRESGGERVHEAEAVLVSTGRRPNLDGLGLERAGIAVDPGPRLRVDDFLRTTQPRVYAAGDVVLPWQFTPAADFSARLVVQNALFFGRRRVSALTVPWCLYTEPELARVGLDETGAAERGVAFEAFTRSFRDVDRARAAGGEEGFVRVLVERGGDRILGATIVGAGAGEMIGEVATAMAAGMGLRRLANVIHPYPTLAEAIRQCGDACNRGRLTPLVRSLFRGWFRLWN